MLGVCATVSSAHCKQRCLSGSFSVHNMWICELPADLCSRSSEGEQAIGRTMILICFWSHWPGCLTKNTQGTSGELAFLTTWRLCGVDLLQYQLSTVTAPQIRSSWTWLRQPPWKAVWDPFRRRTRLFTFNECIFIKATHQDQSRRSARAIIFEVKVQRQVLRIPFRTWRTLFRLSQTNLKVSYAVFACRINFRKV